MMSGWPQPRVIPAPAACVPCGYCGAGPGSEQMYAEAIDEDWHDRGTVIRIGCLCAASAAAWGKDWRTEFEPEADAVADWNDWQGQIVNGVWVPPADQLP